VPRAAARTRRPLAVLFDLDGTLIDSIELILNSARHAFRGRNGRVPTDAEWLTGVGIPLTTMFSRYAADDADLAALIAGYREYQMANHDRMVRAYEGVVTSKGDALATRGLTHVGLAQYFDVIVGCDSCTRHKPDPEPVLLALERLGYEPNEAVFIGDSVHDVAAGNAAGVTTIAALWGPFSHSDLEPSGPTHFLDKISSLPSLLGSLAEG
jgi:pyrophosphatase PpaX